MTRNLAIDGLRGVCALVVLFNHLIMGEFPLPYQNYFSTPPETRSVIQFPILNLAFAVHASISVFMVAGGYGIGQGLLHVLSNQELSPSQAQLQFWGRLTAAPVRRILRLYLPVALLMGASHTLYFCGAYTTWMFPRVGAKPLEKPLVHLWFAVNSFLQLLDPVSGEKAVAAPGSIFIHLWTIPVELRGGLAVLLLMLSLSKVSVHSLQGRRLRLAIEGIVGIWCLWRGRVDDLAFVLGLMIAEVSVVWNRSTSVFGNPRGDLMEKGHGCLQQVHSRSRKYTIARYTLLILALVALSMPTPGVEAADDSLDETQLFLPPTWTATQPRTPVWHTLGAAGLVGFVVTAGQNSMFRRALESRVVQAVGQRSFALYLVHMAVIQIVRNPLLSTVDCGIGKCESTSRSWFAWIVTGAVVAAVVAIVTKLAAVVDQRCVRWSREVVQVMNGDDSLDVV